MSYFIGIVPPEKIYKEVLKIQQPFGDNQVEPHVTIRHTVNPTQPDNWLNAATRIAQTFQPFTIKLTEPGYFRKDVLYIGIQSNELQILYQKMIDALIPFEPNNPTIGQLYHPHLTLGRKRCGFTDNGFPEMETLAGQWLKEKPVSFPALSLRIYHKPEPTDRFTKLKDVPFLTPPGG